jgi:hypothetical protein
MIVRMKDMTGATVLIQTDNVIYVGQAADEQSKTPVLGVSVVVFLGGQSCSVKGTPEEVYGAMRRFEPKVAELLPNGSLVETK